MYAMNNNSFRYDTDIISSRIKELRKLRKYTQQELADAIGVKRQAIGNWEKETQKTLPSVENLIDLCKVLDCSLDYLLGSVDTPEIEPISKASHYSGISPEIIRYGIEHPDFLDCLNFFMHPQNSADIFNSVTLSVWKKFWLDSAIDKINGELKEKIIAFYDEYISITPFESINKNTYRTFLKEKLPREAITLSLTETGSKLQIKRCVSLRIYQNFFSGEDFNYTTFINFLVDHTFDPLSHHTMLEIQKNKLANKFVDLFIKYLSEE